MKSMIELEEVYIRNVHSLVDDGVDISKIYDHKEYVRIKKKLHKLTHNGVEPTRTELFLCLYAGIVIASLILEFGGI